MGETDRPSSKTSARLRPTINLPPRASFDTFFSGGPGFSPGPMTLISNLFSPDSESRSFTQLLAGAMASPAGAMASPAAASPKPNFLPDNTTGYFSEEAKNYVPWDGSEKNWGFKQNNKPMNLVIPPLSPMFTIPSGLSPSGFLNSPGLFSPLQSPFGMSHQQVLAHVTAQAALSQYRQSQTQYQPQFVIASTEPSSQFPFAPSETTQQQVPTIVSEPESSKIESSEISQSDGKPVPAFIPIEKPVDDGYSWRKYGQKQVKASEYPRSYYKCTQANCPVKKKVERSSDGQITEIIYKGQHNHDQPLSNKRPKDGEHIDRTTGSQVKPGISSQKQAIKRSNDVVSSHLVVRKDWVAQPLSEQPLSNACDDVDDAEVALNEGDDDEPSSKRRNMGTGTSEVSSSHKTVTEPKIIVQTRSEVDILDDGYKWRKYGQKMVKGNPHPRSYYRCTYVGCNVRKHVERASMDPKAVITTYEGKHNHNIPADRNTQNTTNNLQSKPQRLGAGKAASQKEIGFSSQEQKPEFLQLKEERVTA